MVPCCARCESSAIESDIFSIHRRHKFESSFQDGPSKQKNADSKTSGYEWMRLYPDPGSFSI